MENQYTKFAEQKIRKSFCSIVVDNKLVDLSPIELNYTGEMNGGVLTLQIHQIYKNEVGDDHSPDREAVLVLPRARTQCITGIDCQLNGKKIDLKIEEEKKAKEIAKEGQKQGRTTIRSENTPDEQFLNIRLGSLSYGSCCELTIRMEIISTNSNSNTYQTIVPFSEQNMADPSHFSFSIVYNEILTITDITVLCGYDKNDFEYTFDGSVLTIDKKPLGPLIILTELCDQIPSQIQNDNNDEYSIISVLPHFESKPVNSDFIFLVDCSGSMSGSRIRNASECLSIFLHSLPVGCRFNIVMFGSDYRSAFGGEGLVEYNEENLQRADNLIKNLRANMGGTDLLPPLKYVYEQCDEMSKKGNIVQIFLITDGEISDAETVFKLVSKNRSKNRIFSIGIGKEADRDLVSGLAILSYGKFDFVSESSQITDKVVNLLSLSLAPALTNVSIHAGENQDSLEIVPNPLTPIYDGNLMSIYVKRESTSEKINQVLINGNIGDEEVEIVIDEVSNICDFSAKKLFAFNAINDYEKLYDDLKEKDRYRYHSSNGNNDEMNKLRDRIVTLSTENGILSKFTSYVGVEENPHKKAHQSSSSDDNDIDLLDDGDDDGDAPHSFNTRSAGAKKKAPTKRGKSIKGRAAHHHFGAAPYVQHNSASNNAQHNAFYQHSNAYDAVYQAPPCAQQDSAYRPRKNASSKSFAYSKRSSDDEDLSDKMEVNKSSRFHFYQEKKDEAIEEESPIKSPKEECEEKEEGCECIIESESGRLHRRVGKKIPSKECEEKEDGCECIIESESGRKHRRVGKKIPSKECEEKEDGCECIIESESGRKHRRVSKKIPSKECEKMKEECEKMPRKDSERLRQEEYERMRREECERMQNEECERMQSDDDENEKECKMEKASCNKMSRRSKKMKSSIHKQMKPPQNQVKIENSLTGIVSSQDFDGKWKFSLFDQFIDLLGGNALNALNGFFDSFGINNDEEINRNIKSTIAALCILNKSFANEKSRWRLIQSKAIGWLNKNHPAKWEDEINKLTSMI